jgi:hypothetical protein
VKKEEIIQSLAYPIYGLFHIRRIEESARGGYLYDIVPDFRERFRKDEQDTIVRAIEEALADPELDLTNVLPDLPFGQEEIRKHLEVTLKRLKSSPKRTS